MVIAVFLAVVAFLLVIAQYIFVGAIATFMLGVAALLGSVYLGIFVGIMVSNVLAAWFPHMATGWFIAAGIFTGLITTGSMIEAGIKNIKKVFSKKES